MDNVMSLVNSSRVENGVVLYNNCFDSKDKII